MTTPDDAILQAAVKAGVLPAEARWPQDDSRPWPVVLLTALGAWLSAGPLLGVVSLLLGDLVRSGAGPYLVGLLLLVGSAVVLRSRSVPLFVEQLAVPMLLVALGSLGFGLFRDLHEQAGAAVLGVLAVGLAFVLPQAWLRVLLGAAAALALAWSATPASWTTSARHVARFWWAWHASAAACAVGWWLQRTALNQGAARVASVLESLLAGALLAVVAGLAFWSGMTLLVGAGLGEPGIALHEVTSAGRGGEARVMSAASLLFALACAAGLARRWPALRTAWWCGVAATLSVLAWFLPSLGAVLCAAAWCAGTRRWRLASAAALAGAWIVGSFYYRLQWPLSTKALVLAGVGAALAALAWAGVRDTLRASLPPTSADQRSRGARRWGFALGAVAVLAVANVGIWQKEALIAHGEPLYIELAPVDPRSLMQGDYMRLNYRMPVETQVRLEGLLWQGRPHLVGRRDARGVLALTRVDQGTPLAPDEMRIELTPKAGRWTVVTDAWFFEEGAGARYQAAKYGEFRVDREGRALLVGLRDAGLNPL